MKIIWSTNNGGELGSIIVSDEGAIDDLIDMLRDGSELHVGDTITVVEDTFVSVTDRQVDSTIASDESAVDDFIDMLREADRMAEIIETVHPDDPTVLERYKGFVIRTADEPGVGFVWKHGFGAFETVEEVRADIDDAGGEYPQKEVRS